AHPGDRKLRVITEFLRDPLGASSGTELARGYGNRLLDLPRAGIVRALQRGHEKRRGSNGVHAHVVQCWRHRDLPPSISRSRGASRSKLSTTSQGGPGSTDEGAVRTFPAPPGCRL